MCSMNRLIKLYGSYGVLGHEKRPVWHDMPLSTAYDEGFYEIPAAFEIVESVYGEQLYKAPDGSINTLYALLTNDSKDDEPIFCYLDEREKPKLMKYKLRKVEQPEGI